MTDQLNPSRLVRSVTRRLLDYYYWGGKRTFYQRFIRERYRRRAMNVLRAREPELYRTISEMLAALGLDPEIPHKKHGDALFLLDFTLRARPRTVLDCGAGISTLIFAHCFEALYGPEGSKGRIISMEEDRDYLERFVEPFLAPPLAQHVELHTSQTAQEYYLNEASGVGYVGDYYVDIPAADYDLVFIDGPVHHRGMEVALPDATCVKVRGKTFGADYLNVLQSAMRPIPLLIDQRLDTRWKIMELANGFANERYHYAAMKFEITATLNDVGVFKRVPITVLDAGTTQSVPSGQRPPPLRSERDAEQN